MTNLEKVYSVFDKSISFIFLSPLELWVYTPGGKSLIKGHGYGVDLDKTLEPWPEKQVTQTYREWIDSLSEKQRDSITKPMLRNLHTSSSVQLNPRP